VGSEEKYWSEKQKQFIIELLNRLILKVLKPCVTDFKIISGECPKGGVDIWVKEICHKHKLPYQGFEPEVDQWSDDPIFLLKGYKSRNIELAKNADVLICIDPVNRKTSGGKYTAKQFEKIHKKPAILIEIS